MLSHITYYKIVSKNSETYGFSFFSIATYLHNNKNRFNLKLVGVYSVSSKLSNINKNEHLQFSD